MGLLASEYITTTSFGSGLAVRIPHNKAHGLQQIRLVGCGE
jgi:hypothetical protein